MAFDPAWHRPNTHRTLRQPDPAGMDSETAALFRARLCPLFDCAQSWGELAQTLETKGFGLAFRDGRLVLTDQANGKRVCSIRFLGTNLRALVARLGRPMVLARRDRPAAGELLIPPRPDRAVR